MTEFHNGGDSTPRKNWIAAPSEDFQKANPGWNLTPEERDSELSRMLDVHTWAALDMAPEPKLLGDLITPTSRIFLVGRTGLGKTLVAHAAGAGMASGQGFLHWPCEKPSRVLIVDGEMPTALIKARATDLIRRSGPIPEGFLTIYSQDRAEHFASLIPGLGQLAPINTEAGQKFILKLAETIKAEVIIFDNVMSLVEGDQKDEIAWTPVLPLVADLTARSIAQIYLDHTGHNTDRQYGSATKAWRMDAVGLMTPLAEEERQTREVAFTLSFEQPGKCRRRTPENWRDFETVTIRLGEDRWTAEPVDRPGGGKGSGKVAPSRRPFYDALVAAITKSAVGAGRTTLETWQLECLRRSLIEKPSPDESYRQRDARYRGFRKAKADLLSAKWIAIDDDIVTDLKGRWT